MEWTPGPIGSWSENQPNEVYRCRSYRKYRPTHVMLPYVIGVLVIMATALLIRRLTQRRVDTSQYPHDMVTMFQMGRGSWTPSVSPFALKLETYLRMAKIPYQNVHGHNMSSKGKFPWMVYKGVEVADSQFCIDYLKRELSHDLNSHLTEKQRATARAFQKMTEENLYWSVCSWAFGDDLSHVIKSMPYNCVFSWLMAHFIRSGLRKEMWGHGIGRHDADDIIAIGVDDLKALSVQLGEQAFFFGERPCEADCAYFGMVVQALHMDGSPWQRLMKGELSNLAGYCDRMQARFWPDWEDCITHGGTRPAKN